MLLFLLFLPQAVWPAFAHLPVSQGVHSTNPVVLAMVAPVQLEQVPPLPAVPALHALHVESLR